MRRRSEPVAARRHEPAALDRCKCVDLFGVRCQNGVWGMFSSRQSRWRERVFWRSRREAGLGFAVADAVNPGVSEVGWHGRTCAGDFADVRAGLMASVGDVRHPAAATWPARPRQGPEGRLSASPRRRGTPDGLLNREATRVQREPLDRSDDVAPRSALRCWWTSLGLRVVQARTPTTWRSRHLVQTPGAGARCRRAVQARGADARCGPSGAVGEAPASLIVMWRPGCRRVLIRNRA